MLLLQLSSPIQAYISCRAGHINLNMNCNDSSGERRIFPSTEITRPFPLRVKYYQRELSFQCFPHSWGLETSIGCIIAYKHLRSRLEFYFFNPTQVATDVSRATRHWRTSQLQLGQMLEAGNRSGNWSITHHWSIGDYKMSAHKSPKMIFNVT